MILVFDWFTIFKYHDKKLLGEERKFAFKCLKNLQKKGHVIKIRKPRYICYSIDQLRRKVRRGGLTNFEILFNMSNIKYGYIYFDGAYFMLTGGYWLLFWFKKLRGLR